MVTEDKIAAVPAATGKPSRPRLCEAMVRPEGGYPPGEIGNCLLLDEKCMSPATVIMTLACASGHGGDIDKCGPHGKDDGGQFCGPCAIEGREVRVTVIAIRPLEASHG
jgi:hypothetical protein